MATCPRYFGKMRKRSQKVKGGKTVYRCESCHRKYVLNYETGRLMENVAI